jgi:cytochrome c oxidase assembly factor CtaG
VAHSPWSWPPAWVELALVAVLVGPYAHAARRHRPTRRQAACFAAGIALLLGVLATPLATLAHHYLLSAHLVQNVALAEWAPLLLVLGIPPSLAAEIGRFRAVHLLTRPTVSLPLWLATYAVWHVPAAYDTALEHHALLHLEHVTYLIAGALLWWPILQASPWNLTAGTKSVYLFVAFVFASPLGLLLALLPSPIYDFYADAHRVWGLTTLEDQQIAGIAMAMSEAIVFFTAFTVYFVRFMAEEEADLGQQPHG